MAREETTANHGDRHLLLIGGGAALVLTLLALVIALVLIFALRSDVAALEDHARKSAKATKAMQEEIASLKEAAAALAAQRRAEPQPQNIDAANPATDCVIRPGNTNALADCIKLAPK